MQEWCKKTPHEWNNYVSHEVKVTAHDKQQYQGWVFTVDPVSASVVLVVFPEQGRPSVRVVMGHAVRDVEVLRDGGDEMAKRLRALLMPTGAQVISAEELTRRRENLHLWLEKNRIPVTEEGETLCVAGVLTISAPYGPEDCASTNEIILARVQSLVEGYPGPDADGC